MLSNSTQVDLADFNKPRCVIKGIAWRWVIIPESPAGYRRDHRSLSPSDSAGF